MVFHPTDNKLFITDLGNNTIEIVSFYNDDFSLVETEKAFTYSTIPRKGQDILHLINRENTFSLLLN
jgi:hypothetical protein